MKLRLPSEPCGTITVAYIDDCELWTFRLPEEATHLLLTREAVHPYGFMVVKVTLWSGEIESKEFCARTAKKVFIRSIENKLNAIFFVLKCIFIL